MKTFILFALSVLITTPAFADFLDYHQNLFKNKNLCDSTMSDQVSADAEFKKMFETLLKDDEQEKDSIIEVLDYSAYESRLRNNETNQVCAILLHDDCYSAYCE